MILYALKVCLLENAGSLFLIAYFDYKCRLDTASHLARWDAVQREVRQTGTYELTETELTFGAKLAWRNASRCIGRIQWAKLQVRCIHHVIALFVYERTWGYTKNM